METKPRFLLDSMLGKLARWLRILGYDAAYRVDLTDDDLLAIADKEDRILITRDRALHRKAFLNNLQSQLLTTFELIDWLVSLKKKHNINLELEMIHSRCSLCNKPLQEMSQGSASEVVPERVRESHSEFWCCSVCKRIYWQGSHWESMKELLKGTSIQSTVAQK